MNIFVDWALEDRLNGSDKSSQKESSSKYTSITKISRWNSRQKFFSFSLMLNGRSLVTDQFFEVGNECCSRAIKSNNSQTQTDNSSLQALWLNSSLEISS